MRLLKVFLLGAFYLFDRWRKMKKVVVFLSCFVFLAVMLPAQTLKSIGTSGSAGYLDLNLGDNGSTSGGTGTFNNGTAQGTTIWHCGFAVFDGTSIEWHSFGATEHTTQATPGTPSNPDGATWSNTFSYSTITGLTSTLTVTLDQPVAGNVSRATYEWDFANADASPKDIQLVWFVDGDVDIAPATYGTNYVGFTDSTNNSLGAIGMGHTDGSGGIDMDIGMLMDSTTAPSALLGIAESQGATYWWSDSSVFDGNGAVTYNGIGPAQENLIIDQSGDADADDDYVSDTATDVGAAMQWELTVPASGNVGLVCSITYGLDTDLTPSSWTYVSAVGDWLLF
jgi:hypothetical protein